MEGLVRVFEFIQKIVFFKEQLCLKNGKCGKNSVELLNTCTVYLVYGCYSVRPFKEAVVCFHFNVSRSHCAAESMKLQVKQDSLDFQALFGENII